MASRSVASARCGASPRPSGVRLVIATHSEHKLRELRELLHLDHAELVSLDDLGVTGEPIEDGETFETNAAIKARFAVRATGLPVLADDSGLEVDALGGGPGVRTRRYAGEDATDADNNAKLLAALDGLPPERRGRALRVRARAGTPRRRGPARRATPWLRAGHVSRSDRAAHRADPAGSATTRSSNRTSEPPGGRTLGLWTPAEKNAISHRARAARRMADRLTTLGF